MITSQRVDEPTASSAISPGIISGGSGNTPSGKSGSHKTSSGLRITAGGIVALAVVLACAALAFGMPYLLSRYYSWQGDRLQSSGDLPAAASAYRHAFKVDPGPAVLDKLGLVYSKERLPGRALAVLKTAVAMAPGDARTHSKLAVGLAAAGQIPAARVELNQALTMNPRDPTAHLGLSDLYRSEGHIAEADRELELAIDYGADTPEAHLRMGELYLARHDPRAEREFQSVLRLDPPSGAAHLRLGYLLMDSDAARAASELQTALDDPLLSADDRARTLAGLAALSYQANHPDDARGYLAQASALRPDPDVLAVLDFGEGITRRDSGDMMGAFHAFTAAVAENPHITAFRTGLLVGGASLYGSALDDSRNGRLDDSERSVRSLIALEPGNPEFVLLLSQVQSARGNTAGAITSLRKVAAMAPRDPEGWLDLSEALFQAGRRQESANALNRALTLAPLWPRLRPDVDMILGKIALASDHPQQAQACFQYAAASHSPMVNSQECSTLYQRAAERVAELDAAHTAAAQIAADQAAALQAAGAQTAGGQPTGAPSAGARPSDARTAALKSAPDLGVPTTAARTPSRALSHHPARRIAAPHRTAPQRAAPQRLSSSPVAPVSPAPAPEPAAAAPGGSAPGSPVPAVPAPTAPAPVTPAPAPAASAPSNPAPAAPGSASAGAPAK